ncbi:MAG TPA: isocitrate lyase/phosphoenolpyruvate mutase family protein [Amycolatopsis sp.]|nr:isocitrate lyase/phosphoenolpyruvate mutase family protein [Amycolatopsis sp.]
MASNDKASKLLGLHRSTELLTVVNVWDVISAKVVADIPGTKALATASHSIAASRGYEDGENIPVDEMIEEVRRIAAATDLPVTADLEGGYGNAAATVRKAIGAGVVGANIEDQMKPLGEAVAQVEAIMKAAAAEGVPDFVLNARTDVFARAGTGRRTRCWPTRSNGATRTSKQVPRSSSSRASCPRSRSRPWSRSSGRSG